MSRVGAFLTWLPETQWAPLVPLVESPAGRRAVNRLDGEARRAALLAEHSRATGGESVADLPVDLESYDHILVAFSGGKDSVACLLHLLERGAPRERIELHHHDVDGGVPFMDWPVTPAYCRAVAESLDLPIYFSYKEGGFRREMDRDGTPTAPIVFETPMGVGHAGGKGPPGTRGKFPQVSPDLSVRWCSAYLKIDVMAAAIRNQERFEGKRTLVVTGERAQESASRARYNVFEPHRTDLRAGKSRRHVDHWRPVHPWREEAVWAIMQRWGVVPHVAYTLGWGRLSCLSCIFGNPNQWASVRSFFPDHFARVSEREEASNATIQRKRSVVELADRGVPYAAGLGRPELVALAQSHEWAGPVRVSPEDWRLPAGAYAESTGPT